MDLDPFPKIPKWLIELILTLIAVVLLGLAALGIYGLTAALRWWSGS